MKFFKKSLIVTLKLTFEASNIIEKLLWITLGLSGCCYIIYLLFSQVISWDQNASFTTQKILDLSEIEFPAITFCSRGATKYSIVERLGNILDPNADETKKKILPLRNALIQNTLGYPYDLSCNKQCVTEFENFCRFPFELDGKVHETCYEQKTNKFICATKIDETGQSIKESFGQEYEECSHNCNVPCVTKDYKKCIFPFQYHERSYNSCTNDFYFLGTWYADYYSSEWCATKVNQTNSHMIEKGYCKKHCFEPQTGLFCSVSENLKSSLFCHTNYTFYNIKYFYYRLLNHS